MDEFLKVFGAVCLALSCGAAAVGIILAVCWTRDSIRCIRRRLEAVVHDIRELDARSERHNNRLLKLEGKGE